jgi:hypothetical protein
MLKLCDKLSHFFFASRSTFAHIKKRHFYALTIQDMAQKKTTQPPVTLEEYLIEIAPDIEFESDEQRIAALIEHDRKMTAAVIKMTDVITEFPELGQVFMGNKPPQAAFAALHESGEDYQRYLDEADDKDVQAIVAERKAKREQAQADEAAAQKRIADFDASIQAWAKKRGLSQEQLQKFDALLAAIANALLDFRLTEAELDQLYGILTYDDDIAVAKAEGMKTRAEAKAQAAALAQQQQGKAAMPPSAPSSKGANNKTTRSIAPENDLPEYMQGMNTYR